VHYVSGHSVDRDDRASFGNGPNEALLRQARAHSGATARLVTPNAECPVCQQPVFFYQNAHGSRVFFDELGPPWPKHPCTSVTSDTPEPATLIVPTYEDLRSQDQFEFIQIWAGDDADLSFKKKFQAARWDIAVVSACYSNGNATVLVLNGEGGYRYFFAPALQTLSLSQGDLITLAGNRISFISGADLKPVEMGLERASARRVLHRVVGIDE